MYQYFAPDFELDVRSSNMDNANTPEYLAKIRNSVIENLSRTKFGPSVQMTSVPGDIEGFDDEADAELDDLDEDENKDARYTQRRWDKYIEKDGELSESEDESENARNGIVKQPGQRKRMNIMDYQNPTAVPDLGSGVATPTSASANGDAASAVAVANGEIHEDIMKAKATASPTNGILASAANLKSANASQISKLSQAGDVEMGEAQASAAPIEAESSEQVAPRLTPPASPPLAQENGVTTTAAKTTVPAEAPMSGEAAPAADVEMADAPISNGEPSLAKAEGQAERIAETSDAQAVTRAAE
jgi:histone deacetylase 1/2